MPNPGAASCSAAWAARKSYLEASTEAKLARAIRSAGTITARPPGMHLEVAQLIPSLSWVRNEWLTRSGRRPPGPFHQAGARGVPGLAYPAGTSRLHHRRLPAVLARQLRRPPGCRPRLRAGLGRLPEGGGAGLGPLDHRCLLFLPQPSRLAIWILPAAGLRNRWSRISTRWNGTTTCPITAAATAWSPPTA